MSTALPLPPVRVVLLDLPRLTRDLISGIVEDEPLLQVVGEVSGLTCPARQLIDETGADMVIVGTQASALLAECRELLNEHAPSRVLAVSGDGREAHVYGVRPYEEVVHEFSFDSVLEARNDLLDTRMARRTADGVTHSPNREARR